MPLNDIFKNITVYDALTYLSSAGTVRPVRFDNERKATDTEKIDTTRTRPARFFLQRDVDSSGVSGTGPVAFGVRFADGTSVLRWNTKTASTAIYNSTDELLTIHGHEGNTRLVWID